MKAELPSSGDTDELADVRGIVDSYLVVWHNIKNY